ncbi:hypothetical protein EVAR_65922_1 [Eumeta japonica]|uniref:Uncharacterized protein n=1 Tax=Eumeta variegata TaxID=151549 RepID=A0A4C2ABX6_EUMVA|nr:hypothetical protein EVAR_65922_1 [Eumeta japonica]
MQRPAVQRAPCGTRTGPRPGARSLFHGKRALAPRPSSKIMKWREIIKFYFQLRIGDAAAESLRDSKSRAADDPVAGRAAARRHGDTGKYLHAPVSLLGRLLSPAVETAPRLVFLGRRYHLRSLRAR